MWDLERFDGFVPVYTVYITWRCHTYAAVGARARARINSINEPTKYIHCFSFETEPFDREERGII